MEKSNSLDSLCYINNNEYSGNHEFKNSLSVNNKKNMKKSSSNEIKNSKQNFLNQEARSYAKLIANYSRAMENDSIYTKSFDQNYGRSCASITDSQFNSFVPPFSKMKKKEIKSGSILNRRNSSLSSPKYRHDIYNKNENRNSFYSTDSGTYKEIVKIDNIIVTKNTKSNQKENIVESDFKLDVKDVLDSCTARADWLDKVIKAHKELKMKNMIQNNNYISKAPETKLTAISKMEKASKVGFWQKKKLFSLKIFIFISPFFF